MINQRKLASKMKHIKESTGKKCLLKTKRPNWGSLLPKGQVSLSSEGDRVPLQNTCKIEVSTFTFFNKNSLTVTFH